VFGGVEVIQLIGWPLLWIGTLFGAVIFGYIHGREQVQAERDSEKATAVTAQRDKEAELQANMDKLREDKNRETAKLRRTVAALTDSLRDRPERPAVPTSASAGDGASGCTGAAVYKQDGEFLIRESARADQIRLALIQCQKAYKSALMLCPVAQQDANGAGNSP
jgi:hypothetical protein